MILTKKLEIEILKFHDSYWEYYLKGNVEGMIQMLDDTYTQVGSAEMEVFSNKTDAVKFLYDTIDQVAGNLEMRNRSTKMEAQGGLFIVHELCDVYAKTDEKWVFYSKFRATSIIQHKNGGWKFIHQHSSFPDSRTSEGENVAIDKIALENEQLKEAIKRRTIELEHQNRELEIEAAVEKVRSASMAMQTTDDFTKVNKELLHQLNKLDIPGLTGVSFYLIDENEIVTVRDLSSPGNMSDPSSNAFQFDSKKYPTLGEFVGIWKAADLDYFILDFPKEKLVHAVEELQHIQPEVAQQFKNALESGVLTHQWNPVGRLSNGILSIDLMQPPTGDTKTIVLKLAGAFNMAYQRFLDLQKAEAQARESQIEAAIERVRSSSMGIHKSQELIQVVRIMDKEIQELGIEFNGTQILTDFVKLEEGANSWFSVEGQDHLKKFHIPPFDHPIYKRSYEAYHAGVEYFTESYSKNEKNEFFKLLYSESDFRSIPKERQDLVYAAPVYLRAVVLSKNSALVFQRFFPKEFSKEDEEIFKRFGKAFEQAYVRFLDLQKAEAQAQEARIEAALERVRSKTMAMHNSNDVGETAAVMEDELKKLGIDTIRCGIGIMHEPGDMEVWTISKNENNKTEVIIGWLDMHIHPLLKGAFESWRNKNESYSYELKDNDLLNYYNAINNYPGYPIRYNTDTLPKQIHHNEFYFPEGILFAFSLLQLKDDQRKIFKRFASVFSQTYRRYLDLCKAEAQAREAQIETALERVRSRTLAMQKSDELAETAAVLFQQLIALGIAPNRLFIILIKENSSYMDAWLTDEDGSKVNKGFEGDYTKNTSLLKMYEGWKEKRTHLIIDMQGAELQEYFHYLHNVLNVPFKGGLEQKRRWQYIAYFSHGLIGMASPDEQPAETLQLLERFASVFNLTFTRFNDLKIAEAHALQAEQDLMAIKEAKQKAEKALNELQATQAQLIQSEKMASLGELTAGIAHEIQNPLNFVNNFSEVSSEILDEVKDEITKGHINDAINILNELKDNLTKITHHGQRASDIVKSMLEHSRKSTNEKVSSDINALCDEYLRLAYYGHRAKDKSFNCDFKLDLDPSLPKINVIQQDISRVILNIVNNAFYATMEKRKSEDGERILHDLKSPTSNIRYNPLVTVSTKNIGEVIEISINDNGSGIPPHIKDKIFQPFFTTKPTGQGTGLGLSLAYDIVKAHGGEITVESKSGYGTEFIIKLPSSL